MKFYTRLNAKKYRTPLVVLAPCMINDLSNNFKGLKYTTFSYVANINVFNYSTNEGNTPFRGIVYHLEMAPGI